MAPARGVSVLSKLRLVRIWWHPELQLIFVSVPWWKPQSGQSLTEYALLLGVTGGLLWAVWYTLGQTLTDVAAVLLDALYPGASWMLRG